MVTSRPSMLERPGARCAGPKGSSERHAKPMAEHSPSAVRRLCSTPASTRRAPEADRREAVNYRSLLIHSAPTPVSQTAANAIVNPYPPFVPRRCSQENISSDSLAYSLEDLGLE